jgi:hypothetical protein
MQSMDPARASAWSAAIAAGVTYAETRNTPRAVRAAGIAWRHMFALGLVGLLGLVAWFVLLVEAYVLFGDHGLSVLCFVLAARCTWAAVALFRSYRRRIMGLLSGSAPSLASR